MCKRIICHIVLLLLTALALPCFGQHFPVTHFTKKDGLPGNMVYQVYRDRLGFLWFATDKGVARYNGIRFETFTTSDGLTDNDVINLFEDHYGRIWLNCFKGNLCYYKDGKIHSAANAFPNLNFNTSYFIAVSLEQDSSFTLLYADRQAFVNIKDTSCRVYYLSKIFSRPRNFLTAFVKKRPPATYEVFTGWGTTLIDTNHNIISNHPDSTNYKYRCRIGQDMTYLVSEKAIYKDYKPIYKFKGQDEVFDYVHSLYINRADTFVGTEKGLIINNSAPILRDSRISDVSQDINGNYWVTTLNNGVYHFSRRYPDTKFYSNSYSATARFAFAEKGRLFFMTSDHKLFRFDKGKVTCIFDLTKYRKGNEDPVWEPGYLREDNGNYHFLLNKDHFILRNLSADKPLIKWNHIIRSPQYLVHRVVAVKGICSTPQYIYSVQYGYFILRLERSKFEAGNNSLLEDVAQMDDGQRIYTFSKSRDNTIWFSASKGMYKLENDIFVPATSFKGLNLHRFYILGDDMVGWNNSNRLTICHNISGRMTVDTLPLQDCIWDKTYRLDDQHLLISTNNQYRVLTLQSGPGRQAYELLTVVDPLIPLDAEHIFSDGRTCYFFKGGNITAVPISGLLQKAAPPRLLFTGVSTSRGPYAIRAGSVSIPYSASGNVHVTFAALAFGMTGVNYEYTVSGSQGDWRAIKNEEINLVLSRHGDYTITIRAKNAANVYSQPVSLLLTIAPPFWISWWFILLAGLCCAGLLWWAIRFIIRYFVKKKERAYASEIKFLKLEYKALNALMNPHFIFNSLNNIQGLVNGDNRQAANQYLVIFADLIRQNMHNASKELITLEKEIELIRNYLRLEKLRFNEWLHYKIDIEDHIDTGDILIPPLLVQPLVENAIRHGLVPRQSADSLLTIHIHEDEAEVLHIDVRDNGAGLSVTPSRPSPYESTGLDNIRKRSAHLKLIHNIDASFHISEITDASGAVQGTLARISISRS
jgi:hypothetical protein